MSGIARAGFPPLASLPRDPLLKHQSPPALSGGFQSPEQYIKHIKAGLWRSKLVLVALINFDWHHYNEALCPFIMAAPGLSKAVPILVVLLRCIQVYSEIGKQPIKFFCRIFSIFREISLVIGLGTAPHICKEWGPA